MGRYEAVGRRRGVAYSSGEADGLPLPAQGVRLGGRVEVRHASVPDPNTARRGAAQRAAVNARHDALEYEYARGRISQAAYVAGRAYGAVLEKASGRQGGAGGFEPHDKPDRAAAHEAAIVARLETAQRAVEMQAEVRGAIGGAAALVVEGVLLHGLSLGAMAREDVALAAAGARRVGDVEWARLLAEAGARRRACERARAEVALAFREGLEALAAHWARRGVLGRGVVG
jgi:hypothetical protein